MGDRELLTVGQLARLSGLTTKALRHYDRLGLFRPAAVDDSGYRWYAPEQVAPARLVARLRALDVPLPEVRSALAGDAATVRAVLLRQRTRLESRLSKVRGDLHDLAHFLDDKVITMPGDGAAPDEKALAIRLFNGVWEYLGRENRTPADDDTMLHMAHASRFHWGNVGTPENLARGEWQCSRVYAALGRAEPSLHHAGRVLRICQDNGIGDWDLAFAYEALARAHAVGGDRQAARSNTDRALAAAADIADPEDRDLLLADLESVPGQPRYW